MYNGNFNSESESGYDKEFPYELSPELEYSNQSNMEYSNESSNEYSNEYMGESGYELSPEFETGSYQNESFEIQLSNELTELSNEYEFGDWLKKLAKKGAGAALGLLNSPSGQHVISSLGNIAQKTLSGLGQRAGSWLGQKVGSVAGANIGNQIAQYGANAGQQLGQMAADRIPAYVRFANNTLQNIAHEISMGQQPQIKTAILKSAAIHYPLILKVKGDLYAKQMPNPSYKATSHEYSNEYSNEYSEGETGEDEFELNEIDEMELASELLSVKNDAELDMFLGNLFKKVTRGISNFAKSGIGKSLGGILKSVAGKALPALGGIIGSAIPIPGVGTMIGAAAGNAAGKMFGLELEGLSGEDREFETARAFVRFGANAARRASRMRNNARNMSSGHAARRAVIRAARIHAPGIIRMRRHHHGRRFGNNDGYGSSGGYGNNSGYGGYNPRYSGYYNPGYYGAPPPPPVYGSYSTPPYFDPNSAPDNPPMGSTDASTAGGDSAATDMNGGAAGEYEYYGY